MSSTKRVPVKRKAKASVLPDSAVVEKKPRVENKRPADVNYSLLPKRYVGKSSKQMIHCQQILKELMTQKQCSDFSWPFLNPVDDKALNIPDYYEIVQNPMDLSTVKKKYNARQYATPDEFYDDVMLICRNCFLYNKEGDFVTECGKQLEAYFLKRWEEMPVDKNSTLIPKPKSSAKPTPKPETKREIKRETKPAVKPVPKQEPKSDEKPVLIKKKTPVAKPPSSKVSSSKVPAKKVSAPKPAASKKVSAPKPVASKKKGKKEEAPPKKASLPIFFSSLPDASSNELQLFGDLNDNKELDELLVQVEKEQQRVNNRLNEFTQHVAELMELKHKRLEAKLQKSALPFLPNALHSEIRNSLLAGLPPLISMDTSSLDLANVGHESKSNVNNNLKNVKSEFGNSEVDEGEFDKSAVDGADNDVSKASERDTEQMPEYEFNSDDEKAHELMSYDEKTELGQELSKLPSSMLEHIMTIIRKSERELAEADSEEIAIDFEVLKPRTLRELKAFADAYNAKNREATGDQGVEDVATKKREIQEKLAALDKNQPTAQDLQAFREQNKSTISLNM